jgi:hypothetical protein
LKKTLLATAAAILLSSAPAFAWPQKFTVINNIGWAPPFDITKIVLSKKNATHSFNVTIDPGQTGTFDWNKDTPCLWWVTVYTEYRQPVTWVAKFNTCTQTTIKIDGGDTAGTPVFTFY